jgi:hypothetical protein
LARHDFGQCREFLAEVQGYSWVTGFTHTVTHKFCEKRQELKVNKTFVEPLQKRLECEAKTPLKSPLRNGSDPQEER